MSSVSRRHWIPQTPRILSHFWKLSISPFECESFVYSTHSIIEQSTLKQLRIVPEEHRSRGSSLVDQQRIKRHLHPIFTQNLKSLYIHISVSYIPINQCEIPFFYNPQLDSYNTSNWQKHLIFNYFTFLSPFSSYRCFKLSL